jgi:hypothetical protein
VKEGVKSWVPWPQVLARAPVTVDTVVLCPTAHSPTSTTDCPWALQAAQLVSALLGLST